MFLSQQTEQREKERERERPNAFVSFSSTRKIHIFVAFSLVVVRKHMLLFLSLQFVVSAYLYLCDHKTHPQPMCPTPLSPPPPSTWVGGGYWWWAMTTMAIQAEL
jgi:hypothetical protein